MIHQLPALDVDEALFRQFADVPPILLLDVALATTAAVISQEHCSEPALLLDPEHFPEPACLTSHLVITRIAELRHLLRLHLAEMERVLPPANDDYIF